jgi:hypothetical protein
MPALASAAETLDREFLTIRSRLLNLAAALDRLDRADGDVAGDPRLQRIHRALAILASPDANRAEQIQMAMSDV